MENRIVENNKIIVPELYFLITKFLANGPFKHVGEVLIREIQSKKILPNRHDWLGNEHEQTYAELERKYAHIGPNHLLEICSRITVLLDKEIAPSVAGVTSLLGAGRQSVLRTEKNIAKPKSLLDYCSRIRSMPILDASNRKHTHNIVKVMLGREAAGPITRKLAIPNQFYTKTQLLRRTLGHLSSVYCVLFDRTGKYIITGADDCLVKLWSAIDGRLLFTYRGASAEITDIAINLENTLLAAGSLDHILRVWDMQTSGPIAVLCSHTGMVTSVNFCPSPRDHLKYLVTTSTDGSVAFWQYTTRDGKTNFAPKPHQYHEKLRPGQAQMIFASFSPSGLFLAAGSADHHVRVYLMADDGPKRILETEAHSDTVDSIQWAHNGLRFISGSKDGSAHVWHFESQQWKSLRLQMSERLPSCPKSTDETKKLKVTMVGWDLTDKLVVTAVNDFTIKVWHADTGKLHRVMRGHTDELYVLESHPKDPHIMISAGHDGKLYIWDIMEGIPLVSFSNDIQGQGHGGVFDAKWSPDGMMIAATDSHGHILMYGFGSGHERLKTLPSELFFHTDYRPLVRDANHYVMDEQTQTVPHLMPPPFLVDIDGNPYPPAFQRLVPGLENCSTDQLVPNTSVGPEGIEVIEGPNSVSNLDRMIAALANRQGVAGAAGAAAAAQQVHGGNVGGAYQPGVSPAMAAAAAAANRLNAAQVGNIANGPSNNIAPAANGTSPRARVVLRRIDVEGVRQSSGNWQRGMSDFKWIRRLYVQPMQHSRLVALKQAVYGAGQIEMEIYRREMRRRPIMISTSSPSSSTISRGPTRLRGRHIGRTRSGNTLRPSGLVPSAPSASAASTTTNRATPAYRTRAVRVRAPLRDEDDEEDDHSVTSVSSDSSDGTVAEDQISSGSSSSDSESSDYSDWVGAAEQPRTLEPPVRSKRKRVKPRSYSPSDGPSGSRAAGPSSSMRRNLPLGENGEIPEEYRPPEWLSEVIPRKAPYYPQMGDEVVYFRQGHQRYLEAVRTKSVYRLNANCEPWQNLDLRDHEVVKVIGIKYEIRPPRLCCLKLALMNNDGTLTGPSFAIKYHDMADVIDFIVLKQTYDTAVRRLWAQGDRFRCMIDDGWWIGQIMERKPLDDDLPDSLFMCFNVRWDNGEYESMSPWDMEPIDESRLPDELGGVVEVHQEELRATLYQPTPVEWYRGDREASCRRIIAGLEEVMMLAIADPFLAPVDLNIYPSYAFIVEYPIDLSTIKARFENHFYRRITSAQFDVRYLATNAEKFNQSDSHIVKHARIITDLCLRIIKDHNEINIPAVYHQLCDTYVTSDSDNDNRAGTSTGGVTPSGRARSTRSNRQIDWRQRCRAILEIIWESNDSEPFREPVDTIDHPDYLQIVDTPMDLRTIKEDLLGGNYESATSFIKDMRRIFSNSRSYNTNRQSRIYRMTQDLSNSFEEHVKLFKRGLSMRTNGTTRTRQNARNRGRPIASTSRQSPPRHYRRLQNLVDDDDDDDEGEIDVVNGDTPSTSTQRRSMGRPRKTTALNGVTSTHNSEMMPGPSTSATSRRRIATTTTPRRNNEGGSESSSDESSDSSSSEAEATDGSSVRNSELGNGSRSLSARKRARHNSDSEESYRPTQQKKKNGSVRKGKPKLNGKKSGSTNRRYMIDDDEDDEDYDERTAGRKQNGHRKQNGTTPGKRGRPRKYLRSEDELPAENEDDENDEIADDQGENEDVQEPESDNDEEGEDEEEDDEDEIPPGVRCRDSKKYDSDQSYREPNRSLRQRTVASDDSDTALSRPTRSAAKRLKSAWGQEEDSLEATHDDEVPVSQQPTSSQSLGTSSRRTSASSALQDRRRHSRRRIFGDDEEIEIASTSQSKSTQAASSSSTTNTKFRSARLNENRLRTVNETANGHHEQGNGDSDSDSDTVLSQLAHSSSRYKRKNYQRPVASSSTSNATNAVTNGLTRTREVLRRRQTTAAITTTTPILLSTRSTNNSNASALAALSSESEATRISRSLVHEDHNYGEPGPSTLRHTRRNTTLPSRHQRNPDELDQPMTSSMNMPVDPLLIDDTNLNVNISGRLRTRGGTNALGRSTIIHTSNSTLVRNAHDDDSDDDASDPEDNKPLGQIVTKSPNHRERMTTRPPPTPMTATRVSRTQKRPHYNEDSDESLNDHQYTNHIARSGQASKRRHITADTSSDDDGEPEISVSSRGRVRKMSSKVRGFFRE